MIFLALGLLHIKSKMAGVYEFPSLKGQNLTTDSDLLALYLFRYGTYVHILAEYTMSKWNLKSEKWNIIDTSYNVVSCIILRWAV